MIRDNVLSENILCEMGFFKEKAKKKLHFRLWEGPAQHTGYFLNYLILKSPYLEKSFFLLYLM